ncbi:MAG: acyl-CoA dehydrogenase family protein [Proteobacteria bacterium]|nr:acyl-CoA dehydrogenase family protein [Pseudomonadota bacterium]
MDLSYTNEQNLIRDSVQRFARDSYPFDARRRLGETSEGFSRGTWKTFAELGWLGVALPEAYGGSGGSAVDVMILMEAFGRALVVEPYFTAAVLGGTALLLGGSEAQKRSLLPRLAAGELLPTLAFAEPQSRFDLGDVQTTARQDGAGFVIDGAKSVVFHAVSADIVIVPARTSGERRDEHGISLFLVEGDAAGLTRRDYPTVDGHRASELKFENVRVGGDALLGARDAALPLIETVVDHGTSAVCAEAVGIMAALYEATLEHLKTREQFGQPIGRFQVLQHRMVDIFAMCEQARSMALMAALTVGGPDPTARRKAVSAAKNYIGRAGRFVSQQAVQLHGAMGMTDELIIGHYFKRLTMIDTLFGNADHHLERFGRL